MYLCYMCRYFDKKSIANITAFNEIVGQVCVLLCMSKSDYAPFFQIFAGNGDCVCVQPSVCAPVLCVRAAWAM